MDLSKKTTEDLQQIYGKALRDRVDLTSTINVVKAELERRDKEMRIKAQKEKAKLKEHAKQTAKNAAAK